VTTRSNQGIWRFWRRPDGRVSAGETVRLRDGTNAGSRRVVITKRDDCCGISDIGLVRPGNEDAFHVAPEQGLLVVADGLGGHAAGEVASKLTIESIRSAIDGHREQPDPAALLDHAFADADAAVREHTDAHPECTGMGATLIVALVSDDAVSIAHVGDVRAYHCHAGRLDRLTHDHTAVGRLLQAGLIAEDDARHHPARNQVHQAIGGFAAAVPEHVCVPFKRGDTLLLCSDGLWDEVSHAEIGAILADPAPAFHLATRLVDKAIAAGGYDNITAVVYRHAGSAEADE
jgi:serine/threonine protein phosphatase PrpC